MKFEIHTRRSVHFVHSVKKSMFHLCPSVAKNSLAASASLCLRALALKGSKLRNEPNFVQNILFFNY
jgi:hypothetical protein